MPLQAGPADERSRTHGALASASRVRILDLLRGSATALDVQQIAEQSDLHPTTVRFHLKILVDAGLTWCRSDPRRGASGRPRLLYTAATDHSGTLHQPGYQLLADILASYLAASSTIPRGVPEEAGRAFARRHRRSSQPFGEVSSDEAMRQVIAVFAELGFQPELASHGPHHRMLLHACPFRALATKYPEVICAVHLGLLKQSLANLSASVQAASLEPFVTPHLCIAHLATSPPASGT
ncbi:MAG TPA: helix-turn-helix domain-containing protein [Pseudonocardiaceae bacterium]|jgi:predicted ArsR family transcriptional regulator|nr:helix-turn-helix domain-containing protein [Pseudonocardiaceae bacterium]